MSEVPSPEASTPLARRVDEACNRFEVAWRAGSRPRIEDFLGGWREPERAALLRELIELEVFYRRRSGEDCQGEGYQARFPDLDPAWLARALAAHADSLTACPASPAGAAEAITTVPGYEILGEVGRGGMGIVYKARHVPLNRLVALKMLRAGTEAQPEELARFRAEAKAVACLQHPHIVAIHDIGEQAGQPYFALEFVDGKSLDKHLAATPQPARAAAQLVETLARAMHVAHQHGILHRDLKPANVLLDADGIPKITDFGLAKRLPDTLGAAVADGRTPSGAIVGTPSYMAPEQARGRGQDLGPSADVYALGAILYEMLTGRTPFKGETLLETLNQVVSQEPMPPRRLQPSVPRDLETVCLKCLQKEPRKRYESAEALADDLRRFLANEPIQARPVSRLERSWRWCWRNPAVAGLIVAVVCLLAGLLIRGLQGPHHPNDPGEELIRITAELDRLDPGWRLEQIEAVREVIPDDQNAALRVRAAARLLPPEWPGPQLQQLLDTIQGLRPIRPLEEGQVTVLRAALQEVAPALAEARALAGLRRGRFAVSWSRDAYHTEMPHLKDFRGLAHLLVLDAALQARQGDTEKAMRSCRSGLNVGRSLGDEPVGTSQVARIALVTRTVESLERILAQGEPSEAALAATQELLEDEVAHPALLIMARGERAGLHWLLTAVQAGDLRLSQLNEENDDVQLAPSVRPSHVWVLRHMTQYVAVARFPLSEQLRAIDDGWAKAMKDAPDAARVVLPPAPKLVRDHLRYQALLRSAAAAVAAERYRQAHGRWPEALNTLVPTYLQEVPADPYDSAPLRYRRLGAGRVFYAVGPDRKDNHGTLSDGNSEQEGTDIGFRLWDVAQRHPVLP